MCSIKAERVEFSVNVLLLPPTLLTIVEVHASVFINAKLGGLMGGISCSIMSHISKMYYLRPRFCFIKSRKICCKGSQSVSHLLSLAPLNELSTVISRHTF